MIRKRGFSKKYRKLYRYTSCGYIVCECVVVIIHTKIILEINVYIKILCMILVERLKLFIAR